MLCPIFLGPLFKDSGQRDSIPSSCSECVTLIPKDSIPPPAQDLLRHQKDIITTNCRFMDDAGSPGSERCDQRCWRETEASRAKQKVVIPSPKP
jgi:hypothetical protein